MASAYTPIMAKGAPEKGGSASQHSAPVAPEKDKGAQPGGGGGTQEKAAGTRAVAQLVANAQHSSITPGPYWMEATNPAAVTVSTAAVPLDLPLYGAAFFLREFDYPIMVRILPPSPPHDQNARFGDEAHEVKPPDYHWWPKFPWKPIAMAPTSELDPQQPEQQLEKIQAEEKQKAEQKQKQQEKQAKQTPEQAQQEQQKEQEAQQKAAQEAKAEGRAVPVPGTPDPWLKTSGMSPKGFPGYPRSIANKTLGATNPFGLPATAGFNRAEVDMTVSPPQLNVYLVGSGSIPANSRWIIYTLKGV